MVMALVAFTLAAVGLRGLIRLKTWGVLALGASAALVVTMVGADIATHGFSVLAVRPAIAGGMLVAAVTPFLAPIARFIAIR
jgi:hypothetical protein